MITNPYKNTDPHDLFILKDQIGKGSWGLVYLAKDLMNYEDRVAIKIIEGSIDDPDILNEINAMKKCKQLKVPNMV